LEVCGLVWIGTVDGLKILLVFLAIGGFLDPSLAYILDGAFPFVGTTGSAFLSVGL
jgi:hypothetical protein